MIIEKKQREIYDKPIQEKLQNMKYFKQKGNTSFRQKRFDQAAYFYNKCILYSDYTFPNNEKDQLTFDLLVMQSNMNMAICLIKLQNWAKAVINLRQVLKIEYRDKDESSKKLMAVSHKKAHYWMTKFYIRESNYKQAYEEIKELQILDNEISSKQQVEELKKQIIETKKKCEKKEQDISKKMFKADK